jgi:transposase IS200 family protein
LTRGTVSRFVTRLTFRYLSEGIRAQPDLRARVKPSLRFGAGSRSACGRNPKCASSIVANNFKTVTSRLLRKQFPALRAKYRQPVLWSRSYFVASVGGAPPSLIKQYIEQQARPL